MSKVTTTLYEMGRKGLIPVNQKKHNDLQPGIVLHWGGNMGFPAEDFVISKKLSGNFGVSYELISLKNYRYHRVQSHSIKERNNPDVWHEQHYFLTDRNIPSEELKEMQEKARLRKKKEEEEREEQERIRNKKIRIGKELFTKYIPDNVQSLIVAIYEINISDSQTDYFAAFEREIVILGTSKHRRNLFSEMRKYADKIPETKHLGKGCGHFEPMVIIMEDFHSNGVYYGRNSYSHWHGELTHDDDGNKIVFKTRQEAEEYIQGIGEPDSVGFDEQVIKFGWKIIEENTEHRENYSGGAGYYLKDGSRYSSGWKVKKVRKWRSDWEDKFYVSIAERCILGTTG